MKLFVLDLDVSCLFAVFLPLIFYCSIFCHRFWFMDPQGDENYVSGASEVGKVAGRIANTAPRSVFDFWWTGRVFKGLSKGGAEKLMLDPDDLENQVQIIQIVEKTRKHEYETKRLLQTFLAQIREDRDLFLSLSGPPAGCQALQAMQLVGAPVVWEAGTTWQDFECLVEVDRIFAWYLPFTSVIFALAQGMHPVHIVATQNPRPDNTSKRKDVGAQEDVGGVELWWEVVKIWMSFSFLEMITFFFGFRTI